MRVMIDPEQQHLGCSTDAKGDKDRKKDSQINRSLFLYYAAHPLSPLYLLAALLANSLRAQMTALYLEA